jgi:tight adherence protein B
MSDAGLAPIYAAVFVGVLLALHGVVRLFGQSGEQAEVAINRRLRKLATGADPKEVLRLLRRQPAPEGLDRIPLIRYWPTLVAQSAINMRADLLAGVMAAAFVLTGLLLSFRFPLLVALAGASGVGLLLPIQILRMRRDRRRAELTRQLPDAIDLTVQSLRVGHPLSAAFQVITREMPDPIATELETVADAVTYGDSLTMAMDDLAVRVGAEEFYYVAVAINIQHSTGGNLASVLETLSRVIRDRFAMEPKVVALSAEGRITALVVSVVPLFLAGFLHLTTPSYYGEVADDPLFKPLLVVGMLLTVVNAVALRRLVRFHI